MKKRLIIFAGILAVCFGLILAVLSMLPPRPGVTKANFDRIEMGMTLEEIEAVLGKPFGKELDYYGWYSADGSVARILIHENRIVEKYWVDSDETFADKFCRWLHVPKSEP